MLPSGRAKLAMSPRAHRVRNDREDDGDRAGRLLGGHGPWRAGGDDDVDLEARQLGRKLRQVLELPAGESVLD